MVVGGIGHKTNPGRVSDIQIEIHLGDNLDVTPKLPSGGFDLIYIDPPFNT